MLSWSCLCWMVLSYSVDFSFVVSVEINKKYHSQRIPRILRFNWNYIFYKKYTNPLKNWEYHQERLLKIKKRQLFLYKKAWNLSLQLKTFELLKRLTTTFTQYTDARTCGHVHQPPQVTDKTASGITYVYFKALSSWRELENL